MRKFLLLIVAALAVVAMSSTALAAVNVKSLPTATFGSPNAASVSLTGGNFSGLGSVPAIATLTVQGSATYTCTNQGGNASPGQNPVPAQPGSANQDLGNADHNGRGTITDLTASVTAGPTPSPQQVGCGGGGSNNWTVTLNTLTATSAQLVIKQDSSIVFCRNYITNGTGFPPPPAC